MSACFHRWLLIGSLKHLSTCFTGPQGCSVGLPNYCDSLLPIKLKSGLVQTVKATRLFTTSPYFIASLGGSSMLNLFQTISGLQCSAFHVTWLHTHHSRKIKAQIVFAFPQLLHFEPCGKHVLHTPQNQFITWCDDNIINPNSRDYLPGFVEISIWITYSWKTNFCQIASHCINPNW